MTPSLAAAVDVCPPVALGDHLEVPTEAPAENTLWELFHSQAWTL